MAAALDALAGYQRAKEGQGRWTFTADDGRMVARMVAPTLGAKRRDPTVTLTILGDLPARTLDRLRTLAERGTLALAGHTGAPAVAARA